MLLMKAKTLLRKIDRIGELDDHEFRAFEFELVSHYRRSEPDQEVIAVEIHRYNRHATQSRARHRLEEIMAMLEHVHDPLIR
jgi:hypothetical protein